MNVCVPVCLCLNVFPNLLCVCNQYQSSPGGHAFGEGRWWEEKGKEQFLEREKWREEKDGGHKWKRLIHNFKECTLIKERVRAIEETFQNISWIVTEVTASWLPAVLFTLDELHQKFVLKVLPPLIPPAFSSICLMLCQHNLLPCVSSALESALCPSEHFTRLSFTIKC